MIRVNPAPLRKILIGLGFAALGIGAGALWQSCKSEGGRIEIDAEIDQGSSFELYVNKDRLEPYQTPIVPGERHTYQFTGLPDRVNLLRLDPTDVRQATVRIYAMRTFLNGRLIQNFGPEFFKKWPCGNAESQLAKDGSSWNIVTTSDDPILESPKHYTFWKPSSKWENIWGNMTSGEWIIWILAIGFICLSFRKISLAFAALPLATVGVMLLVKQLVRQYGHLFKEVQSASTAVGYANYFGFPKQGQIWLFLLAVVAVILFSWLVGLGIKYLGNLSWLRQHLAENHPAEQSLFEPAALSNKIAGWLFACLLLLHVLGKFPNLFEQWYHLQHEIHEGAYDWHNVFAWDYAIWKGLVPLKDFWFPYGEFFGTYPRYWFTQYLHFSLLVGVFAFAVFQLTKRSLVATLAIVVLVTWQYSDAIPRYFLALNLVLLCLMARETNYQKWAVIFWGAFGAYIWPWEMNQIAYAILPLGCILFYDFWVVPKGFKRIDFVHRLAWGIGIAGLGGLVYLIVLYQQGRLVGTIDFLQQMSPMAIYGSLGQKIQPWFSFNLSNEHLLLLGLLALIAYGIAILTWAQQEEFKQLGMLCLGMGALTVMPFLKQIVRPHIAFQILPYVLTGFLLLAARSFRLFRFREQLWLCVAGGLFVGTHSFGASLMNIVEQHSFKNIPGDLQVLFKSDEEIQTALKSYYFDENRYPAYREAIRYLKTLIATEKESPAQPKFYVLGDHTPFYTALDQQFPYYITFYNMSPIQAQENTVSWLITNQPPWVIWSLSLNEFDRVPNIIRLPVVFEEIITKYQPMATIGEFEFLKLRGIDDSVAIDYWRKHLGDTLDLKKLPAYSALKNAPDCPHTGVCTEVLEIKIKDPGFAQQRQVAIVAGGQEFFIVFDQVKHIDQYAVNLERIWFWQALRRLGLEPILASKTDDNLELTIKSKATPTAVLY